MKLLTKAVSTNFCFESSCLVSWTVHEGSKQDIKCCCSIHMKREAPLISIKNRWAIGSSSANIDARLSREEASHCLYIALKYFPQRIATITVPYTVSRYFFFRRISFGVFVSLSFPSCVLIHFISLYHRIITSLGINHCPYRCYRDNSSYTVTRYFFLRQISFGVFVSLSFPSRVLIHSISLYHRIITSLGINHRPYRYCFWYISL